MKKYLGQRLTFTAIRGQVSVAKGTVEEKRVCLNNIKINGVQVKDHSWITWDKRTSTITKYMEFEFKATVAQYISLDENHRQILKYKLVKVREVKAI